MFWLIFLFILKHESGRFLPEFLSFSMEIVTDLEFYSFNLFNVGLIFCGIFSWIWVYLAGAWNNFSRGTSSLIALLLTLLSFFDKSFLDWGWLLSLFDSLRSHEDAWDCFSIFCLIIDIKVLTLDTIDLLPTVILSFPKFPTIDPDLLC